MQRLSKEKAQDSEKGFQKPITDGNMGKNTIANEKTAGSKNRATKTRPRHKIKWEEKTDK